MTMMDGALLERRREINRKAARKSRSRQKEFADQIRKKYYEAQSANTKLVYERKRLVRERDELKTKLRDHRRSCSNYTGPSSEQCSDLVDEDLARANQIQPRRSTSQRIPSTTVAAGSNQSLSRSFSCPESKLQWTEDAEDELEEVTITSSDDDEEGDENEEEEEAEEEVEKAEEPVNPIDLFSADYFSFTELDIGETSRDARFNYNAADLSLIGDQPPLELFHFEDQSDFLEIEEGDPFSILDDLPSSPSAQVLGRSISNASLKPSKSVDFTRSTDSSQSSLAPTKMSDLGDPSGTYYDDQQSEAIDLSKPRATLPTPNPSPVNASISVRSKKTKENAPEPPKAYAGNIPLHVQTFIVGEK